jgi:hypothetical protein
MSVLTHDALCALDGPALTAVAVALGLAPEAAREDWPGLRLRWEPHRDRAQGDRLLRKLRARGWATTLHWYATTGTGLVDVRRWEAASPEWVMQERFRTDAEEALALLRCAVWAWQWPAQEEGTP